MVEYLISVLKHTKNKNLIYLEEVDSGNILGALFLQEPYGRNIQFSTTSLVKALPSFIFIIFPHIFIEKKSCYNSTIYF